MYGSVRRTHNAPTATPNVRRPAMQAVRIGSCKGAVWHEQRTTPHCYCQRSPSTRSHHLSRRNGPTRSRSVS